eukprot:GHUV01035216.1.p1 GENE.GHUV01035216.1~~GHUV01035216.1.p1  ORF type:complete len:195 (+),score=51.32 GHUV01035216.1:447-1031(+)
MFSVDSLIDVAAVIRRNDVPCCVHPLSHCTPSVLAKSICCHMPGHETTFLVDTVGDALSKGVAAMVAAQPADPVEYLAEWLLRYVEGEKQQVTYLKAKKQQVDQEKRRLAQALEENERQEAESARKAATDGLAATAADPLTLWQTAVRLVKMYTTAAGVYVANIVDDEELDWTAPDDPEADVETDDAADTGAGV